MGPILCAINKLSPYYEVHNKPTDTGLGKVNNCFWYIYGALLQQGLCQSTPSCVSVGLM